MHWTDSLPEVSKKLLDYFIHVNEELKTFRQARIIENQSCLDKE